MVFVFVTKDFWAPNASVRLELRLNLSWKPSAKGILLPVFLCLFCLLDIIDVLEQTIVRCAKGVVSVFVASASVMKWRWRYVS